MAKRFTPATGAPPKMSMSRPVSSGTTSCLMASRPSGSSTSAVPGASLRSATPWLWLAGAWVLQLCAVESARLSSASTSTAGGGGGGSPSTSFLSKRTEKSHQKISNVALPLTRNGRGPSSEPSTDTLNRLCEPYLSCTEAW